MALKLGRQVSTAQQVITGSVIPPGTEAPFTGDVVPAGWLFEDGRALSRTQFSALFAVIGTKYGIGDGSTTFNIPDGQGTSTRCHVAISTVTGSGPVAGNNATFLNHGIYRTGFKVRVQSGTITGLAASTTYYAIVVSTGTLAFATTYANAIAGTKIVISGTNTAVITQWEDPDKASRLAHAPGGATGGTMGSRQDGGVEAHTHQLNFYQDSGGGIAGRGNPVHGGASTNLRQDYIIGFGGSETRMVNQTRMFIIKY